MKIFYCMFFILAVAAAMALPAQAAPIAAGNGDGTSTYTGYGIVGSGWTVAPLPTQGSNVPVYLDPSAGPWFKNFGPPKGGYINGQIYSVVEQLQVVADPSGQVQPLPWTDYHEFISPLSAADWLWVEDATHVWGMSSNQAGLAASHVIDQTANYVDWTFTPAPGAAIDTSLTLTKYLQYIGFTGGTDTVLIGEYPTSVPEPSALALLAAGLTALLCYAWRKRK